MIKKIFSFLLIAIVLVILATFIIGMLNSKVTSDELDNLVGNFQNSFVGDNSAVSGILSNMPLAENVEEISLQTDHEPYEIKVKYSGTWSGDQGVLDKDLEYVATTLFAFVQNVDKVTFEVDLGEAQMVSYDRDTVEMAYEKPLSYYAESRVRWANDIIRGPLDMSAILELSESDTPNYDYILKTIMSDVGLSQKVSLLETYELDDKLLVFYVIQSRTEDQKQYGYGIFDTSTGYYKFDKTMDMLTLGEGLNTASFGDDYYFLIDNEACKSLEIKDAAGNTTLVTLPWTPFVYRYADRASESFEYQFKDAQGVEMK